MIDVAFYLVSEEVARRAGVIDSKYRTQDGRFILDNKDLDRMRLTSEEFVNGISDAEMITREQAKELIAANRYAIGEAPEQQAPAAEAIEESAAVPEESSPVNSDSSEGEAPTEEPTNEEEE